jgi:DNA-binding XRE family transcriptional regulator
LTNLIWYFADCENNCIEGFYKIFDKSHLVENSNKKIHNLNMAKSDLKKLGKNIKFLRKAKGLSQEKLAEIINRSRNYIGMIERAEVNTPVDTLFNIAKALHSDIKELFG